MSLLRLVLKGTSWVLGAVLLLLAMLFGINATDEELSPEALAAMKVPPAPPPREANGYMDFLVLSAPADAPTFSAALGEFERMRSGGQPGLGGVQIDPGIPYFRPAKESGIDVAAKQPGLAGLIEGHRVFLQRYRAMREKPEFIDVGELPTPDTIIGPYRLLVDGQRLALFSAAVRFNAGDRTGAVREIEAEYVFFRKVAAGGRTLIAKMIAFAMLDRVGVFTADLARRMPPREKALLARLEALQRPPTTDELDVVPALRLDRGQNAGWARTRSYVRMSDETYETFKSLGEERPRPWWDAVAPYLYRPHQSVNLYVARSSAMLGTAEVPGHEFLRAVDAARERVRLLEPSVMARWLLSPAGEYHWLLAGYDMSDYIGRAHGYAGVQTLVRLQVKLRAAGITAPAAVTAALAGPMGREHLDPFTGKPVQYDPETRSIGFEAPPKLLTGTGRDLQKSGKRVALPL